MKVQITYDSTFKQRPQEYVIPNTDIRVVVGKDAADDWVIFCRNNTHVKLKTLDDVQWLQLFASPHTETGLPPGFRLRAEERLRVVMTDHPEYLDVYQRPIFNNPEADAS